MLITDELFASFVKCETKSYLTAMHVRQLQSGALDLQRHILDDYKEKCWLRLAENISKSECSVGTPSPLDLASKQYALVVDCTLGTKTIQSTFHALERSRSATDKPQRYIPIRFAPAEKLGKDEKLQLAFDALVIFERNAFATHPSVDSSWLHL